MTATRTSVPHDTSLDRSLSLLREGYNLLPHLRRRYQSDIFTLRILGQEAVCLSGAEGAELFYDQTHFKREGALPRRILTTLMGQDGVQTLDGAAHRHRKALFMAVMTPGSLHRFSEQLAATWRAYLGRWEQQAEIQLFGEAEKVFCRAACTWCGMPFEEGDIEPLTEDLSAMIDAFGGVGPRHARGKRARHHAEKWTGKIIDQVRAGRQYARPDSPLAAVAWFRDLDDKLLPTHVASVELLNLLRPIVAIGRYVTFAALALHEHPEWVPRLRSGDATAIEWFVQEVRRYYPFTPLLGARVRAPFEWGGYRFKQNQLVLLNVHGIDHDARQWADPHEFRPERFADWNGSAFNFLPQGGGDYFHNHRCAGEWLTIEAMKTAAVLLTTAMTYEVPPQDLRVDLTRMPTLPASGFVMRQVRATGDVCPAAVAAPDAAATWPAAGGKCPFGYDA